MKRVTTEWDIVSDVLLGAQVTEKKAPFRRPGRVPSSAAVAVLLAVSAATSISFH
jgi:hypothetical protein